jgi:hypothetical protein
MTFERAWCAAWLPCLTVASALALASAGCGGAKEIPFEDQKKMGVINPTPDNPFKDITPENEYLYMDKIHPKNPPQK